MKIPIYPDDFDDYSIGVDISNERINGFIKEGLEYLQNNIDDQFYNNGTGNADISIFREPFREFTISVTKNYMESRIKI